MTEQVAIELKTLKAIIKELKSSLAPMVPYRIDPFEFCNAAHDVKDAHIQNALSLLPAEIVAQVENE